MKIKFQVPGKAVGKGRPRFSRRSGRCYTPAKTSEYEVTVAAACREAMGLTPPTEGAVTANIVVYKAVPKSWSKAKKAQAHKLPPLTKPDVDNIAKAVLDGCNGIAYKDDSQVTNLFVTKIYTAIDMVCVSLIWKDEE